MAPTSVAESSLGRIRAEYGRTGADQGQNRGRLEADQRQSRGREGAEQGRAGVEQDRLCTQLVTGRRYLVRCLCHRLRMAALLLCICWSGNLTYFLGFGKGLLFCSMWGTSAIVKSPSRIFIKVHVCVLDNIHVWLNIVY